MSLRRNLSGSHVPSFDAVRGASAFMVVFAHLGLLPRQAGALGVAIFFVLSGFLITWLLLREHEKTGTISLRAFYARRALRLFPAFYVFWLVCVKLAMVRGADLQRGEVLSSFFYMGDYWFALERARPGVEHIMGQTWSLGVEEKFYLAWPFLTLLLIRMPRALAMVAGAIIAATAAYRIAMWTMSPLPADYLRYAFESRFDNLLVGCVVAIMLRVGVASRVFDRLTASAWGLVPTVALLLASVAAEEIFGNSYHYVAGMTVDAVLVVAILLQVVACSSRQGWRWLEAGSLRYAGRLSYSIYLYHVPAIALAMYLIRDARWATQIAAALTLTIAFAVASYHIVEMPFLALKKHFLSDPARTDSADGRVLAVAVEEQRVG